VAKGSGRKDARWGEGRVAYAALAPEIVKALEEGLPMSKVHALFEGRLGIGYRQFVRYANRSRRTQEREHDRMTHPQGPFKSLPGPKPVTALPAPASFQAPALQEASISIPQTSTARSSSEVETRQGDAAIRKVHFILNSKGGVGKSFIAFLLALHYRHLREPVLCFDADATTATFSRFPALNVTRITLMEGTILNARRFD